MPGGDYDESRGGAGLRDTAGRGSPQAGRALVVGAGVGGLAAAWWLATAGWAVEVVERAPAARTGGFVVDLFGAGYATAERMGLAGALRAAAQPVDGFAYVTEAGRRRSGLPPAAYRRALNGRIVSVLRTDLIDILAAALPPAVRIRYGEAAVAVTDDGSGVRIQLAGGARLTGDVLVGADGLRSTVRRQLGAGSVQPHRLGLHVASYLLADDAVRARLGGRFLILAAPGRHAGAYPLRGGRVAAFFAHRAEGDLPPDPRAGLRAVYGDLGWVVPRLLARIPEDVYVDHAAQVRPPVLGVGRVALVGDAGHAVSLVAGQGASLALASAEELGRRLAAGPAPEAVAGYAAAMGPVVDRVQRRAARGAGWFVPRRWTALLARDAALRIAAVPGVAALAGNLVSGRTGTHRPAGPTGGPAGQRPPN